MLRSLGRNGVADRYVHRHSVERKQLVSYPFLFTGVSSPGIIMPRLSELVVAGLLHSHHRSASSKSSKDEPSAHTIPPAPHKTKVELRPGPIKPLTAPSGSHPAKVKQTPTTNASSLQPTSPTTARSESIAETVKEDFKQAYIHGVLARPPPGAGKIATLWHQAKELFVCRAN